MRAIATGRHSRLWKFVRSQLSNPLVGAIGALASLLSLATAVYFYIEGQEQRELTYRVQAIRTPIVTSRPSSRLEILYDGKPISRDITAAKVAIWNRGKKSIRMEAVLEPVKILVDSSLILEASITKRSRDACRVDLEQSELRNGRVGLEWKILEEGDGAVVEVIYAGSASNPIEVEGVIEGQESIERAVLVAKASRLFLGNSLLVAIVLFPLTLVVRQIVGPPDPPGSIDQEKKGGDSDGEAKERPVRDAAWKWLPHVSALVAVCSVALAIAYAVLVVWFPSGPPFGF